MDNKNILTMAGESKSLITIDNWCYEIIHQFNNFKKAASYCKEHASKLNIILSIKRIDSEWFVLKRSFDREGKIRNPATAKTRIQTPKNSYNDNPHTYPQEDNSYQVLIPKSIDEPDENSVIVIDSISRGLSHLK